MDWNSFLKQHGAALVFYARQWTTSHADAEEVVQDAIIRFWQAAEAGKVSDDTPLPLIYTNIKWVALDRYRSSKRRDTRELAAGEMIYDSSLFEKQGIDQEQQDALGKAVTALPEEQREVVIMKIWSDMTFKDIGEALGISINTAASRYRYALGHLKTMLRQEGFDYDN